MPRITINGKTVEVKEGSTIIQAFKESGQDICHYCWHPGLSVAGVCRLCMVQIEGMPRLQIACNTEVKDGMVVNNTSDTVKETVRWGLDFHLINHPLDCPICDQAGECGLQDQYMKFGSYDPEMAEKKVKKHKVVDLGPTVVLDSERCILCSRCVRFTDEVSKTHELGIFNRGDRSEIGTVEGKPLDNKYSLNTVDICPVGALTSKDFRFRQRVWYLKEGDTICSGCSTGCNVKVHFNEEGVWRVKPVYNKEVNGHWMCDEGRDTYKHVNLKVRMQAAQVGQSGAWQLIEPAEALRQVGPKIRDLAKTGKSDKISLLITGQYTNEEYESLFKMAKELKISKAYHWFNKAKDKDNFDGILLRGDRNPNTHGLLDAAKAHGIQLGSLEQFSSGASGAEMAIVAGPEDFAHFPELESILKAAAGAKLLVWLSSGVPNGLSEVSCETFAIPTKTYIEKMGSFTNHAGLKQCFKVATTIVPQALNLSEICELIQGRELNWALRPKAVGGAKANYAIAEQGAL